MKTNVSEKLKTVRTGLLLSLLTLFLGFALGLAFGAFEGKIKGHLKGQAAQAEETAYNGDEALMKKITDKSWVYMKRAHLHANGLGVIAVCLVLLTAILPMPDKIKTLTALCLGLGAFGYSIFWMLAGLKAPGLASTGAAKESLRLLAMPSSGLCMVGLILVFVSSAKALFCSGQSSCSHGEPDTK